MINMKMTKEETKEYTDDPSPADAPEYPYGLSIDLDDGSMEKLGITELPKVGDEMTITAKVVVTSTSSYDTQGGDPEKRVCLQITDMEMSATRADTASVLYGN